MEIARIGDRGRPTDSFRLPRHSSRPFFKTVWLDHISFAVTNYKESAAFYVALLGWKPGRDEGSQNECEIGDLGNIIIRGGGGGGRGGAAGDTTGGRGGQAPARRAVINHISFGLRELGYGSGQGGVGQARAER